TTSARWAARCLRCFLVYIVFFFFSSRRRHTRSLCDWSSDVCSSDLERGHEIGIHGDRHRRVYEMTPAEFREDLARARDAVERAGRVRTTTHRAAGGWL